MNPEVENHASSLFEEVMNVALFLRCKSEASVTKAPRILDEVLRYLAEVGIPGDPNWVRHAGTPNYLLSTNSLVDALGITSLITAPEATICFSAPPVPFDRERPVDQLFDDLKRRLKAPTSLGGLLPPFFAGYADSANSGVFTITSGLDAPIGMKTVIGSSHRTT